MTVLSLFDGKYEVTTDGSVFSNVGTRKKLVGKTTKGGYPMVVLNVEGKKHYELVHRLVAKAFLVIKDGLKEVNHKDGNKLNNTVDNLEWCSSSQNQIHARDAGLQKCKINMTTANKIREIYSEGIISQPAIAKMFSLGKTQVGYIINNKRWIV